MGCYTIRTKDGFVLIVDGARHIATVNQGRWRFFAGEGRGTTGIRRACLRSDAVPLTAMV